MHRLGLLAPSLLAVFAACTAPVHAVVANAVPVTRYVLQPTREPGGEGMHSAWHTSSRTEGTLEIRGHRAVLVLETTASRDPISCQPDPSLIQACAPAGAKSSTTTFRTVLEGTWTGTGAQLDGHALACATSRFGLRCTLDARPLAFASSAHQRFTLASTALVDGQRLAATLDIAGTTAHLRLALAGEPAIERTGRVSRAPAGLVIETGGPVGRTSFICTEVAHGLTCEAGIDHEVFDRPSTYGPVTFVDG